MQPSDRSILPHDGASSAPLSENEQAAAAQTVTPPPAVPKSLPAAEEVDAPRESPERGALPGRDPRSFLTRGNLLVVAIVLFGALLRLWDVNWDQSTHIHPDERFLTMVGTAVQLPSSLGQYFSQASSPLNPANAGCSNGQCPYTFYVYGILPITLNKLLAVPLGHDNYDAFTLQGRVLSAFADIILLILLYFAVLLLERRRGLHPSVKYIALACYAVSVLPIQLAHFFAVDSFLNLFMFASFIFALRYAYHQNWYDLALSAVSFGLALASKTSALFILPLDLYFILIALFPATDGDVAGIAAALRHTVRSRDSVLDLLKRAVGVVLAFALVSYVALRLGDPYYFQNPSLLDPRPSHLFMNNLATLRAETTPSIWFPPSIQWIHKLPVVFALVNLVFFGLGLPLSLAALLGCYIVVVRRPYRELAVILVWATLFFLFQSVQFAKTMRYFIFLYPFLAIYAGIGLYGLATSLNRYVRVGVALTLLIWPAAFMSIYMHNHPRYDASVWMYKNLPNGSYIVNEEWDDPLPLQIPNPYGKTFTGAEFPSFAPDLTTDPAGNQVLNADKWNKMNTILKRADYIVLSSNRGWGSLPTVPEDFPRMTKLYRDLFNGTIGYKRVATFTSYPSLRYLGIPIDFPDQWSEEAFTVYDHPEVMIFKHVR